VVGGFTSSGVLDLRKFQSQRESSESLKAMRLTGMFEEVRIDHVSRSKKSHADSLATIASKIKKNETEMEKDIKMVKRTIPTSLVSI
jgi:hypothetical protein